MLIYLDSDFKCYAEASDGLREVECDFFDEKCQEFINGYRFVPKGEIWVREDGIKFVGEMIAPLQDYVGLQAIQLQYEQEMRAILHSQNEEKQQIIDILIGGE